MPTSDMIFFIIGVADYTFLLLFIAATGFITRREARAAEKDANLKLKNPDAISAAPAKSRQN